MADAPSGALTTVQLTGVGLVRPKPAVLRSVSPIGDEGTDPLQWPISGGPIMTDVDNTPASIIVTVSVPSNIVNTGLRTVTVVIPYLSIPNSGQEYTYSTLSVMTGTVTNSPPAAGPAPNIACTTPS